MSAPELESSQQPEVAAEVAAVVETEAAAGSGSGSAEVVAEDAPESTESAEPEASDSEPESSEAEDSEDIEIITDGDTTTNGAAHEATEAEAEVEVPPPSIDDEEAFPALGSASTATVPSTPISWGPSMSTATTASAATSAPAAKSTVTRSKNVQEAFNISNVVSLDISKADFAKIIGDLKRIYSVSIESTLSSITKNRSFIVTGKPKDVLKVRKELVRRLTKPVHIRFRVPAKTRSAIIGAGGKTLKPIIESTSAKINIEKAQTPSSGDTEEDETIEITVEGDVDGVEEAKQSILKIVDEETKHLTAKVPVPEQLVSFVKPLDIGEEGLTVVGPNKSQIITISGLRENVLSKKAEILASFESLSANLKTENKTIPKRLHQFIEAEEIFKAHEVVVKIPDSESPDELVSFIGLSANIGPAITLARDFTSKFTSDSLDISKAHGNNVNHARALAAFFEYSGILKKIGAEFKTNVSAPPYSKLASKSLDGVKVEISGLSTDLDAIKSSRKSIIQQVNNLPPSRVRFITDINNLFSKRVASVTESAAKANNVAVIPLSHLSKEETNEVIFIALEQEEEDFAPSQEEIDSRLSKVNDSLQEIRDLQADLKQAVLDVPSDKQQFIEGPNGTTLRTILAAFEDSALTVKLHNDGEAESSDKVFIEGSKADVSRIEKEIASLLKDAADVKDIYSFESTIQVATSTLSRLIGKNGANLTTLRDQFGVEVQVEKNPTGEKASLSITGYKFNVKEAEQYISQSSKKWADEITKTLIVPKKYRSSLIGLNGQHVKKLQTKYSVRINFSQNSDEVVIKGPSRGTTKAEEELKDLLDFEIENGYTKEISIPQSAVARVIGRQGDTINRIAVDAGIDIKVQSTDKTSDSRAILLTGSRKGLTEAEKQINAIVKEIEDVITVEIDVPQKYYKDILGARGSRKQEIIEIAGGADDKDYRKLLQIPEQGSESTTIVSSGSKKIVESIVEQVKKIVSDKENAVTQSLEIPKEKHRLVIGSSGSVRRSLEEEFNVQISIPRVNDKSNLVEVTGSPENVEKTKAKIDELIVDDWKAVIDVPAYLHLAVSERGAFPRRLRTESNIEVEHGDASNRAYRISSGYPHLPKDALGAEEETIKFTIGEPLDESKKDENDVIPWRLKGDTDEVAKVEKLIKAAIVKYRKDDTPAFLWVKDPSVFGKVVGPQGSRLTNIRNKSHCQIYVSRSTDKVNNVIYLFGEKTNLEVAEKLLRSEIEKK